jgi:hypothetical protein
MAVEEGSVNYPALEDLIEPLRFEENWNAVKDNLGTYAKIFESSQTHLNTPYHADIKAMKAYYWLCMTEMTFYTSGDFDNTIDCLRRAIAIFPFHQDITIIMARILLYSCNDLITLSFNIETTSHRKVDKKIFSQVSADVPSLLAVLGEKTNVSRSSMTNSSINYCKRIC